MNDAELAELIRLHRTGLESPAALIERALDEISETAERIRQDSRANREAIINEGMNFEGFQ